MKKKTGFIMIVFFLVLLVIGFYSYFGNFRNNKIEFTSAFDDLKQLDLDNHYPDNPSDLVTVNNKILLCLYGGGIKDEEIEPTLVLQRKLFAETLMEIPSNSLEIQLANVTRAIEGFRENGHRILQFTVYPAIYDRQDRELCTVDVTQFTNANVNNYVRYHIIYEDENWKLLGWELILQGEGQ